MTRNVTRISFPRQYIFPTEQRIKKTFSPIVRIEKTKQREATEDLVKAGEIVNSESLVIILVNSDNSMDVISEADSGTFDAAVLNIREMDENLASGVEVREVYFFL